MPEETSQTYFTIKCIELESTMEDGYTKDSLERFLNQYVSRGVQGPVRYFCETESEVFAKIRVVMEFMQQDLSSVDEIQEMIKTIELEKWSFDVGSRTDDEASVSIALPFDSQVA